MAGKKPKSNSRQGAVSTKSVPISKSASEPVQSKEVGTPIFKTTSGVFASTSEDTKGLESPPVTRSRSRRRKDARDSGAGGETDSKTTNSSAPSTTPTSQQSTDVSLLDLKKCILELREEVAQVKSKLHTVKEDSSSWFTGTLPPKKVPLAIQASHKMPREITTSKLMVLGVPDNINKFSKPTLHQVYMKMCALLGYQELGIPMIRMSRVRKARYNTPDPKKNLHQHILMVDFLYKHDKVEFFSRYMKIRRKMRAPALGLKGKRIYIHEYLTAKNYRIKKRALELKEQGKLKKVAVWNGIVFVVAANAECSQRISDIEGLNKF